MRIALYARVSTIPGKKDDTHKLVRRQDVDMQINQLREYCAQRGWHIVCEYVDKGISGSKASRPQLNRLMEHAGQKRFDAVLVWKLDRFARSVRHLVNALAELESCGVSFISFKEAIDLTTASGRLMFTIIGAMAEFERELIRERVKAGMANSKAKGKRLGRPSLGINREQVATLKAAGATWDGVADALGCSRATAKRAYGSAVDSIGL
jgi:DNA invertase Pin-like site-specific DNA recombinase